MSMLASRATMVKDFRLSLKNLKIETWNFLKFVAREVNIMAREVDITLCQPHMQFCAVNIMVYQK